MHKHLDHPALLNLPDTYSCICQLFPGQVEQFIPGMKIENRQQGFAVVAAFFKAAVFHHPADLIPQDRNTPRAVGVKLRGVETEKAHFANGLLVLVKAFNYQVVGVDIPVHSGAS